MVSQGIIMRIERSPNEPVDKVRPQAERLVATAKRLDALLGEFKDFVREQRLALQEIDLVSFLGSLEELWRSEAESRSTAIEVLRPPHPVSIRADPEKLHRVFDNLVKNALEAIDSEAGRVEIEVEPPSGESVRISVRDTGPGIPEDVDIFALFETTKPHGTGLGLPICREIVLAHGGEITHGRNTPRGAVFQVALPVHGPPLA
jgi:signal transduction histidine kinase